LKYFAVADTYLLQIPLWCITLSGLGIALVVLLNNSKKNRKNKQQKEKDKNKEDEEGKAKKKHKDKSVKQEVEGDNDNQPSTLLRIFKIVNIVILALSFLYILFLTIVSLFAKPYIRLEGDAKEQISTVDNIQFYTTVPIRIDELKINLSPNQDYTLNFDNLFFFDNLVTSFEIVPRQNFPADSKVVTYYTGISNIWPGGRYHEQNLEFFTPPLPEVDSTNFPSEDTYMPVETEIEVNLNGVNGEFVYWDVEIKPEAEYDLEKDEDSLLIKLFDLKQGTEYSVILSQAERIFDIQSGKDLKIGELKGVATFNFKTTPPPNIEDYNRKDEYMSVHEPLEITFSDRINAENIEEYFVIEPEVEGSLELDEEGKILSFIPANSFEKASDYKVTIKAGLKNQLGGYLEEDSIIEFSTPGYVYVSSVYPRKYSSGISKELSSVSITFDQPVNKPSAQSHFSITPSIDGSFFWRDNSMYYSFKSKLPYSTKFTIRVSSGVESLYGYNMQSDFVSTFTTEEEVFILNVPQYYQTGGSFACNLVATRMALGYKGISASNDGMKSSIGIGQDPNSSYVEGYGVHWGPISGYISSRGVSNTVKSGWNVYSLVQEVKAGHPVILFWYNGFTTPAEAFELEGGYTGYHGMHSEVVVGFVGKVESPSKIILNDPWRGRRYLTIGTFNGLWSYLGNKAIVVY
jgi:hypothetical protein